MTAVTFTGLASGIDSASLITQLVNAERAPLAALTQRQSDLNSHKSIVGSLSTALAALGTAMRGLALPSQVQPRTASSSDGHVTVAASTDALATVHSVFVKQLARAQVTASREFDSAAAGVLGIGSVTITAGATSAKIDYSATDSLSDIAAKINNADIGASASVLFNNGKYRLMVASTGTGTAAAAQFADAPGSDSLQLSTTAVEAKDATATIDGIDVTRSSNVIDDAVTGLTFTLVSQHAQTDAPATVNVTLDTAGLKSKLQQVISAYNSVNSALHAQLDYTGARKGTDTLFGDFTLRQLQGALGNVMTSGYGSDPLDPRTLGAVGLTRSRDGTLTLDDSKLTAALAKNPNAIGDLFVTGGFASAMTTLTDNYSRAGDGLLTAKTQSLSDRSRALQSQADHINARADALQTQLQNQFTALETAMSKLKSQSSYLSSVLG